MRTERLIARACLSVATVGAAVPCGFAADVRFDPSVDFIVFYDGNVQGVGEEPTTDIVGGIGVTLPWSVRTPSATYSFSYHPRREIYSDNTRADFTSHALTASAERTLSERASYTIAADYSRSDRQELDPLRPSDALTYTSRRTFQSGGLSGLGTFAAGRRSSLSWRVGARANRGEDLEGSSFEDSESYDAAFGWALNYSPQGTAGLAVLAQRFTYEILPSVDVLSLGHTGTRRFSHDGTLTYAVGALRSQDGDASDIAGSLNVGAVWTTGQYATISTGVRQGASAGDGTSGATLDRGGYVTWAYTRPRGFGASISAAYWDRENLNDASSSAPPPSAFTVSDSLSWRIGRFFRLGVFHTYRDQSAPTGGDPALSTSYHSGGVSGTWILRGERRAAE